MTTQANCATQIVVMMSMEELAKREADLRESIIQEVQNLMSKTPATKEYLTTSEVIEQFSTSQTTLWRLEKEGVLIPLRNGRKKLFSLKDIENALVK